MRNAAGQRGHRETAAVAVAVEHALKPQPTAVVGKLLAAVTLIQIKAGFVTGCNVERQLPAVLVQYQANRSFTAQPAGDFGQALTRTATGIRALVQLGQARGGQQGISQHGFPALGTAGEKLRHQRVTVTIHDQPRQTVRLAVHQPQRVALNVKTGSGLDRARAGSAEKRGIDALCLHKTPDPGADFGSRTERRPSQELPLMRLDPHRLTAVGAPPLNGRLK